MKARMFFMLALVAVLMSSCITTFYQVYKTVPSNKMEVKNNLLVYEDNSCKVSYNFWDNGGSMGFDFYNKTDQNIYLNLEQSFFVINGMANDYYKNRVFTKSISASASKAAGLNISGWTQNSYVSATNVAGIMATSAFSVAYNEEKIVIIPPKTAKNITEYSINTTLYRDCDLLKYPTVSQVKTKTFTKDNSPYVFSNMLAYTLGENSELVRIENQFYISEITNYPENVITEQKADEFCGQKKELSITVFKSIGPDRFYIKYEKGQDYWKH